VDVLDELLDGGLECRGLRREEALVLVGARQQQSSLATDKNLEQEKEGQVYLCYFFLWKITFPGIRVAKFFLVQHTKTVKIYEITTKYTKWQYNVKWP
jgi:hypothetical protein